MTDDEQFATFLRRNLRERAEREPAFDTERIWGHIQSHATTTAGADTRQVRVRPFPPASRMIWLSAAAGLLIAVSTGLWMRRQASAAPELAVSPRVATWEVSHRELGRRLGAVATNLRPATLESVRRNLEIIDRGIAQVAAVVPESDEMRARLEGTIEDYHRQRYELLRHVLRQAAGDATIMQE